MGDVKPANRELLILAAFSRHEAALSWAREQAEREFGPVALASPQFAFKQTAYYAATMGEELRKMFWAFERLFDPARLADVKLKTNDWEQTYAALGRHAQERPLNLDPGYLNLGKLVLASTKDHGHRVYLRDGIYAEVTLQYQRKLGWQVCPWTFPDYRTSEVFEFLTECREYLYQRVRG